MKNKINDAYFSLFNEAVEDGPIDFHPALKMIPEWFEQAAMEQECEPEFKKYVGKTIHQMKAIKESKSIIRIDLEIKSIVKSTGKISIWPKGNTFIVLFNARNQRLYSMEFNDLGMTSFISAEEYLKELEDGHSWNYANFGDNALIAEALDEKKMLKVFRDVFKSILKERIEKIEERIKTIENVDDLADAIFMDTNEVGGQIWPDKE